MSISDESVRRQTPIDMTSAQFRQLGYMLVDRIGELLDTIHERPVAPSLSPGDMRSILDAERPLPQTGADSAELLNRACDLLIANSTFNGHPRFWGYITSSPAPMGMLGDFLASAINANVGGWKLSPAATEIELQTVRWIAEFMGYPTSCSGLLVSGGNMANIVGFMAARVAKAGWDIRAEGLHGPNSKQLTIYASKETHTWIQKAADLTGIGTDAIRWVPTDTDLRMDTNALRGMVADDRAAGLVPFLVVGSAGTVSTGAVDPLREIAAYCREQKLWFHVDGAYAGVAAGVRGVPHDMIGLREADSVAIDPHKWLYSPLEAGCALVRDPESLRASFSYHPPYYHFGEEAINLVDFGPQNSRGFRALKVWLLLQQIGRDGYVKMIEEDMQLARHLFELLKSDHRFDVLTYGLSITTFRYLPADLRNRIGQPATEEYLNDLNKEVLFRMEKSGKAFVSNAVINGAFVLRACVVNFRTSRADIEALLDITAQLGELTDCELRPKAKLP